MPRQARGGSGVAVFFAVSTGRAGSQTLAHVLTQSPSCICLHEPEPQLVAESARFCYGESSRDEIVRILQASRVPMVGGRTYGETNNRFALMIEPARQAFPDAQFVWLLRDGRDFVASELQRGAFEAARTRWWAQSKWERWRLDGQRVGAVDAATWASWDAFTKLCWQWSWVNRRIERDLGTLGTEHARVLRIEDLAGELVTLVEWLHLEPVDFVTPRSNRRRSAVDPEGTDASKPNNVDAVHSWGSWTPAMRRTFEEHAGATMDQRYPGWRREGGDWRPVITASLTDPGRRVVLLAESNGVAPDEPAAAQRIELAEARARAARLEVALHEERLKHQHLTSTPSLLAKHLAVSVRHRLRRSVT